MNHRYLTLLLPCLLLGTAVAMPPPQTPEKAAQEAAEAWLRLIDAGQYSESWYELAEVAKARIPKESWEKLSNDGAMPNGVDEGMARKLIRAESKLSLTSTKDKGGVQLVYMHEDKHHSTTEVFELVQEEARGWRVAFYLKMANTFLFWPGSPISSGEKPQDDSMPTGDPKGVPGAEPVRPGTGGSIGSGNIDGSGRNIGATAVDERPVPLNAPQPRYSREARDNKVEGVVIARLLVGEDGAVKQVRIVRGLPDGLSEEAVRCAYELRFKPAMKGGKPVAFWQAISIEFNLR
jgi:TonB family protein